MAAGDDPWEKGFGVPTEAIASLVALVDNAPDILSRFDRDLRYLYINKTIERLSGLPRASFLGKTYREVGYPEDTCALWDAALRATFATGEPSRVEFSLPRPDGGVRYFESYSAAETAPDGTIPSVFAITRDITERVETQRALREGDERLRLAVDSAAIGIWDFDPKTGVLRWDDRCRELFGLPPGAPVDYSIFLAGLHPDDRQRTDDFVTSALDPSGDGEFDCEYRTVGLQDGGTERWIRAKGRALFDPARTHAVRFIGTVIDITPAKQAEAALYAAAEDLRRAADIFRLTDKPVALGAEEPRVIERCNPAFARLYGYETAEEMIGKPIVDIYAPDMRASVAEFIRLSNETGHVVFESEHVRRDGTIFPVEVGLTAIRDESGAVLYRIANVTDITERRRIEAERTATIAALRRAEEESRRRAEHEALLNRVSDAVRTLTEPEDILQAAMGELGHTLGADRCYFAEYDVLRDWARVGADWHRPDLPSLTGVYRLSELDLNAEEMFGGPQNALMKVADLTVPGAEDTVFSPRAATMLLEMGLRSVLGIALFEGGLPVAALMTAMAETPRAWTPDEIERVRALANLLRSAMEDARERKREHVIAERLQAALQPSLPGPGQVTGLELEAHYRPALTEARIGGDFYDVFPIEKGCFALVVADLSGKGLAAAAQVASVRHMLRALLYERGSTIAEAVTLLNVMLAEHDLLDGFATLFVGAYDGNARHLTYTSCGQEPGLLLRRATGTVEELGPTGPVLGGFASALFVERRVALASGDVLALFTDGLTESGLSRKDLLGVPGVTSVFRESAAAGGSASEITDRIIAGVENIVTPAGIRDDVCLLLACVK